MTSNSLDPQLVHEYLILTLVPIFVVTLFFSYRYLKNLGQFFEELKQREPELWAELGNPNLKSLLFSGVPDIKMFYAFLPTLRERAKHRRYGYKRARVTYQLLCSGLTLCAVMFALVFLIIFWMEYHGL